MQEPDERACQTSCVAKRRWSPALHQARSTAESEIISVASAMVSFRRYRRAYNSVNGICRTSYTIRARVTVALLKGAP